MIGSGGVARFARAMGMQVGSENHYRALLDAMPDPVVAYDTRGIAIYSNEAFEQIYGWSKKELMGRRIDFVPPEEIEPTREAWERTLKGEKVMLETRRFTKDKKLLYIQLRTAIIQDRKGRHIVSIVIHRDVTASHHAKRELEKAHQLLEERVRERTAELSSVNRRLREEIEDRKQAEASLNESKKRLDLAMEATSDALWDWDLKNRRIYYSPRFYTMLDYRPYEMPQRIETWKALVHPDDRSIADQRVKQYVRQKIDTLEIEYRLKTKKGGWRWIMARGKVVDRDENGTPVRMVGTHVDITKRRLSEEALRQSEADLREENLRLRSTLKSSNQFGNIIGKSAVMRGVYETILRAAPASANVIIYGESGTGKELVAQTIHELSDLSGNPFVTVNCGAIPANLMESEFFGYKKGAFTGAIMDKPGYLDNAEGGTLFMDEVGELDLNMQVKLLRAIEGGGYTPIGGREVKTTNVRIIAATNRDLKSHIAKGLMRKDFYYRIHIIPIHLPPLRDRKEDLPLLIHHFLRLLGSDSNIPSIPESIMGSMQRYDWPGNVRELQNTLHRYITLRKIDFMDTAQPDERPRELDPDVMATRTATTLSLSDAKMRFEKKYIQNLLREHQWHKGRTAAVLKINRKTLFRKLKHFGL